MNRLNWPEANQQYLVAHLDRVHAMLTEERRAPDFKADIPWPVMAHAQPPALDLLCERFDLSPFERDLLLLCVGMELDARFPPLCASLQGPSGRAYPTFSLALAVLPDAHWSALTPAAPLRYWQILEPQSGFSLVYSPLQLDERILHYLAGVTYLDARLDGIFRPLSPPEDLLPSQRILAEELASAWRRSTSPAEQPVIQLCGDAQAGRSLIAAQACAQLGLGLYALPAAALPEPGEALERMVRLWQREAILSGSALLIDCDSLEAVGARRERAVRHWVESDHSPLILSTQERLGPWERPMLAFEVQKPTSSEQRDLWQLVLGEQASLLNGWLDGLVAQFDLSASAIRSAARQALSRDPFAPEDLTGCLWAACRVGARPQMEGLAQRIHPVATWDDLILPQAQTDLLREIVLQVRQRTKVYRDWDFYSKGRRGLGISALFSGPSGTGKTMAAEVLAGELELDLYRIDLSMLVSKYIGETEKNLRRVFEAAEAGGAILLFDEADALFGKRSEVKDSHDRYANIEVSYLLQRMETYRGLAILTTNLKDSLDQSFLRRLRFVVQFPFPDATQRSAIWAGIFPEATPTQGLEPARLAQLNLPGGNIRNIALNAAFLAAGDGGMVRMSHLLHAARREYARLDKSLTSAEIRGWDDGE